MSQPLASVHLPRILSTKPAILSLQVTKWTYREFCVPHCLPSQQSGQQGGGGVNPHMDMQSIRSSQLQNGLNQQPYVCSLPLCDWAEELWPNSMEQRCLHPPTTTTPVLSATRLTAAPGPRYIQSTESEGGRERATDCVRRTHLRGPTGAAWLLQTLRPQATGPGSGGGNLGGHGWDKTAAAPTTRGTTTSSREIQLRMDFMAAVQRREHNVNHHGSGSEGTGQRDPV
ncbi:unnamed protein product [Lota lota]